MRSTWLWTLTALAAAAAPASFAAPATEEVKVYSSSCLAPGETQPQGRSLFVITTPGRPGVRLLLAGPPVRRGAEAVTGRVVGETISFEIPDAEGRVRSRFVGTISEEFVTGKMTTSWPQGPEVETFNLARANENDPPPPCE
ncbi:MAG: hypothetical protein U1E50_16270 [Caulobacteraceae bacterium]